MSFFFSLRVILIHLSLATFLLGATSNPISVVVSNETVPPGGTVQLKFSLSRPALIEAGELAIDLDPALFGSIATASAFSANGDAYGLAQIKGLHVDVHFGSLTGGVGQLPGMPLVTVTAMVLATAVVGQTASVTADPGGVVWMGPQGNTYAVSVSAGTVTIGGALSIASVTPSGGLLASSTVIEIDGTGFSSATIASIDGVSVASVQVPSLQKMLVALGGPTELTGKRIRVVNPDGSEVDTFPFIPGVPVSAPGEPLDGVLPILPLQTYTAAVFGIGGSFSSRWMAIRNTNPVAVNLLLDTTSPVGYFTGERSLTIPAGGWLFDHPSSFGNGGGNILVLASAPVQIVQLTEIAVTFSPPRYTLSASPLSAFTVPPLQILADASALSWVWQVGTAPPSPQFMSLGLPMGQPDTEATISATAGGGNWLAVRPAHVNIPGVNCNACVSPQVLVNPGSMAPGIYRGEITITPVATAFRPDVVPIVIPVALTVTSAPLAQTVIAGTFLAANKTSAPMDIPPGMFSGPVSVNVVTDSGGNWLSATPDSASAPTSITVQANTAGFDVGTYTGDVVVTGSGNTLVIPVFLNIEGAVRLNATGPPIGYSLTFAAQAGAGPLPAQLVQVSTRDCNPTECFDVNPDLSSLAASVQTHSGSNWLSATVSRGAVLVSANAAGLRAGVYLGAITLTATGVAPGQFPVVLVVENGPLPALVAGPGMLSFEFRTGSGQSQQVCLTSGSVPINFAAVVSTTEGGDWLRPVDGGGTTPGCMTVVVDGTVLPPGVYSGYIMIRSAPQGIIIPVKATVTPQLPVGLPLLAAITNAASEIPSALSPGEIVTIHGANLGPMTPAGPSIDAKGKFSTIVGGASALIGGYPAPILYASQTQINVVVPYEVAGQRAITVQTLNMLKPTAQWTVPSTASAPGIFTADGTGLGSGAVLNADSTLNSPSNPTAQGTTIQIFATGEGLTNPPGKTGSVATEQHQPVLPVGVMIGGVQAQIVYEGSAPTEIEGLFQINAVVPNGITPGDSVPILLTVGQAQSQAGVTIAVQ
jgi:uncharacterized protein (TIGR03437 family)